MELSWMFSARVGKNRTVTNVYDSWDNLVNNRRVAPNNQFQIAKMPSDVITKKRAIIIRLKDGSNVVQRTWSGVGIQSIGIPASDLVGQQLGYTTDGIHVYMGATITNAEIGKINTVTLENGLTIRQDYGTPLAMGTGYEPPSIYIASGIIIAVVLVVLVIVAGAGVFIAKYTAEMMQSKRDIEEINMRKHVMDDVVNSTKIEEKWKDEAGNTWIKYYNGALIKIDTEGNATVVVKGTDMTGLAEKIITDPYGDEDEDGDSITNIIKWGVILIAVGVGGYVVYRIVKAKTEKK